MARHVDHCDEKVKVLEQCQVSPPPGCLPPTSLPLSFLDLPLLYNDKMQSIFFYDFPHSRDHFLQTLLPILKHSLSLTLQHFFPFVGTLVIPTKPHFPHIVYSHGDSITLTVAESATDHFSHLVADTARDVRDSHSLVPVLPKPRTSQDGAFLLPLMAIQLTIFPNSGYSICITFDHTVADGRSFLHFMKIWSSLCRSRCDSTCPQALPCLNREIIKDPKGLMLDCLEILWSSPKERIVKELPNVVDNNDKVRCVFMLSRDHVEKLKKWVFDECKSYELDLESLHISTFVVTSALMWVCLVRSEEPNDGNIFNNDEIYELLFFADCRNRGEFSIPSTYFGNCIVSRTVSLVRNKLMRDNGIVEAVVGIGREVKDFQFDAMKNVESFMHASARPGPRPANSLVIAGSPKIGSYETDFGWGKPKKCELLQLERSGAISLLDCKNDEGGVEVGLVLGRAQMSNFSTIFKEYIANIP
ncbi:hypothetical protein Fmac_016550 [Flemingia macrophylla]|uniref:Uncharacterized protein n=1 Tax=Flemingia macrophylla TaxID=520843 RepID=A0ABD1MHR7_9FABA